MQSQSPIQPGNESAPSPQGQGKSPVGPGLGKMLLISGPSGCGKSTICKRLLEDTRVVFSVSATTRPMRDGEVDGRDYYFLSTDEFRRRQQNGDFIEWAEVYGNLYGTLRKPMDEAIAGGKVYLVEIDVQGAIALKTLNEPGLYIFIAPPSHEILRRRLIGRGSESDETLERRLRKADWEMTQQSEYDEVVVNDDLESAVAKVRRFAGLDTPEIKGDSK